MINRKKTEKVLDVNAAMQGSLVFSDPVNLRINGEFRGDLTAKGNLVIGENAQVNATINGEDIVIAGKVKGKIKATKKLTFKSTAYVEGEVHTPVFSIEEGAIFNGRCNMTQETLSLEELSEYLSVEEEKIMEWVNKGSISAQREGDKLFFNRKEVEAWISQNQ
jgi:excisionase family DNA binding protein